jgi:hypothetical protein
MDYVVSIDSYRLRQLHAAPVINFFAATVGKLSKVLEYGSSEIKRSSIQRLGKWVGSSCTEPISRLGLVCANGSAYASGCQIR